MSENVTEPIKATWKTSYAAIFGLTVVVAPFVLIALLWLANRVLPVEDAQAFKAPLLGVWATIAGASGIGTILGGLLRTHGKITAQVTQAKEAAKQVAQPLQGISDEVRQLVGDKALSVEIKADSE